MPCTTVTTGEWDIQHLKAAVEITPTCDGILLNPGLANLISRAAHTGGWLVGISGIARKDPLALLAEAETMYLNLVNLEHAGALDPPPLPRDQSRTRRRRQKHPSNTPSLPQACNSVRSSLPWPPLAWSTPPRKYLPAPQHRP